MKPTTYLLWVGPFVLLAGGMLLLMFNLKKRKKVITESPLSDEEHQKLDSILHSEIKISSAKEKEGR